MVNNLKSWFVVDFANIDLENDREIANFIKKWTPEENPPHTDPEWFYIISMVYEARKNGAEENELIPLIFNNKEVFIPYQNMIRNYLQNYRDTTAYNLNNEENKGKGGRILVERIVSDNLLGEFIERLNNIRLTVKIVPAIGSSTHFTSQVIVPDLEEFENCLIYDFYQYVSKNSTLLVCKSCGNYISNPSKSQFSNARRGLATLHATFECRDTHNLKKDNERNKKKYKKKKENAK